MPTCSEIEHTETRVMEGISGEFIWNEQSGMPPEKTSWKVHVAEKPRRGLFCTWKSSRPVSACVLKRFLLTS